MACKYYLNGVESRLYTDLFGYMDNTASENKTVKKLHSILKDYGIATKYFKGTTYIPQNNFRAALREVKRINDKYPGLISTNYVKMTPQTIYSPAAELHVLNINEDLLKAIPAEGTNSADITSNNQTEVDQYLRFTVPAAEREDAFLDDLARKENTSNSKFSNLEEEELKNAYKVSGHLIESFAKAGITVNVEFDSSIDNIGQVDSAIEGENPTIRINPEKVKKDTTYHEFGHIYIDLLGVDNPVVAKAILELQETPLYAQVEQAYPELLGEMLDKEVLATAIGLEGAKITRKNPNKLQRIINRIMRAIGNIFGVTPNTAAVLAEEMFAQELRSTSMIKSLSNYTQASKDQVRLQELVDNARVRINSELYDLNLLPEDQIDEEQKVTLLRLESSLTKVEKVEDLFKLVDAMAGALTRTEARYEELMRLPEEERGTTQNLNTMWALKKQLDSLEMFQSIKSLLLSKKRKALNKDKSFMSEMDSFEAFTNLEDRVNEILDRAESLDKAFVDDVVPMLAQSMIGLTNKNIPKEIQAQIDNMVENQRTIGLDTTDLAYLELQKDLKVGRITEEEFTAKKVKLNVEQFKQKQLLNYKDLVSELTAAHKDKSAYSYYFDPIAYSSDRGIQLLVKAVQKANLESNDMTLDLKSKLAPAYEAMAEGKNESNVEKLNDPFLEEVTINGMKRLGLVNPIDSEKYYSELEQEKKRLGEKHGIPKKEDYNEDYSLFQKALQRWGNTESKGGRYRLELLKWNQANTKPVPGWEKERDSIKAEMKTQSKIIVELKGAKELNTEALSNARIRKNQLEKVLKRNLINNKAAGDWVQPNPEVYKNAKYEAIQNDPALKAYYDFVIQEFQVAQRMIGLKQMEKNNWDKYSYLMPTYRKEDIDRLKEKGLYNTAKDTLSDSFTIQETNHDYYTFNENNRDVDKRVPVYAVNRVPSKEVSKDIASSLYRFRHMAHNFKSKSEIVGQVNFFRQVLKNRPTLETNSANIQLIQKAAASMGISMPKLKEGESNNYKHVNEWLDSIMYGQSNLKQDFTVFGKTFSANEGVSTLNAFTAMSTLSFNLLQGANQSILDNMMMLQEGFAGQFMNKSDIAWGKGEYWGSGMAVTDIGRFDPKSKIGKAVEFFDALTEFTDTEGNQIVGGKARKFARSGNLLFLQQAAEHELSATRMLALMKNLEGTFKDSDGNVILTEDGKPTNLYDLLVINEKTGKMSLDSRIDEKNSEFNRLDFITKLQGLSRRTNQIKSKMHTNMLSRRWYGKLFMLFRNWLPSGIRRRYGHGGSSTVHVDEEMGVLTQGMYISFWNLIQESVSDKSFAYGKMTEMEQQNIKRTAVELSSLIGAMVLVAALADLDDEDETWLSNFALYQAKRYETEIMQWTPLVGSKEAFRILQSPTATARPILKGGELLGQILSEGAYAIGLGDQKDVFYQRKTGRFKKGDRKIKKDFEDLLPIFRGINKSKTPQDAYKWFTTLD